MMMMMIYKMSSLIIDICIFLLYYNLSGGSSRYLRDSV